MRAGRHARSVRVRRRRSRFFHRLEQPRRPSCTQQRQVPSIFQNAVLTLLHPEWRSQSDVSSEHFPEMQGLDWAAGPSASGTAPLMNTDAQSQIVPLAGNFVWQRILIPFQHVVKNNLFLLIQVAAGSLGRRA